MPDGHPPFEPPIEILKRRYAAGEFLRICSDLEG